MCYDTADAGFDDDIAEIIALANISAKSNLQYSVLKKLHMKKGSKLVKFMKKRVKTLLYHPFLSCTGMYVFKFSKKLLMSRYFHTLYV